jgi:hypothetical protein
MVDLVAGVMANKEGDMELPMVMVIPGMMELMEEWRENQERDLTFEINELNTSMKKKNRITCVNTVTDP